MISGLGPVPNPVLVPGRAIPRSGTGPGRATSRSRAGPRASDPPTPPPPRPVSVPPPPTPGPAAPVPAHRLSRGRARSRRTPGASAALMAGGGGAAGSPPPPPPPSGSFSPPRRARRSPPRSRSRPGCSPAEPPARPLLQRRRCETGASTPVPAPPKPKIGLQIRREGGKSKVGYRGGGPNPKGGGGSPAAGTRQQAPGFSPDDAVFPVEKAGFYFAAPSPSKGLWCPDFS